MTTVRVRRIGVVLQTASTGGWRFLARLFEGIRTVDKEIQIDCYLGESVHQLFGSDQIPEYLDRLNIRQRAWQLYPVKKAAFPGRWLQAWRYARRFRRQKRRYTRQIEALNQYDLVFFPWPYFIEPPAIKVPIAFLPHDLNYSHFMGAFSLRNQDALAMREAHERWLATGHPVVSTRFIAEELATCFPEIKHSPRIIHLSRLSNSGRLPLDEARAVLDAMGIHGDYVLSVNNASYHKNIGQVLGGFYYLTKDYPDLKLVICGFDTEGISGRVETPYYIDRFTKNINVLSVGMRTDKEVAALIQGAKMVVNASLYEAGNGSGLDAWHIGTPVAMSNIPPFLEQMDVLKVEAEVFNPRCCYEICRAMKSILDHPVESEVKCRNSRLAMEEYNWSRVAENYLRFFDDVVRKGEV